MSKSIDLEALEAQIRECFGRVIYTHKTHSKMADRAAKRLTQLKIAQIVLSSLTASGAVTIIFTDQIVLKLITALMSFGTVTYIHTYKFYEAVADEVILDLKTKPFVSLDHRRITLTVRPGSDAQNAPM